MADPSNPELESTTCTVPQTIAPGASYTCEFMVDVPTGSGDPVIDTVTASGRDDDGAETSDSDSATVDPISPGGNQELTKSALPRRLPEPGGVFTYTVRIVNRDLIPTIIFALDDDVYGDIADRGNPNFVSTDCTVPQLLFAGDVFTCQFSVEFLGNAGDSLTDTVTATTLLRALTDSATVDLTDVLPAVSVSKTASPSSVAEPGGEVTYTIAVTNDSTAEEAVLTSLVDDVHGDLDRQGTCSAGVTIAPTETYTCSFSANVSGDAGEQQTDFVFATLSDDEGNSVIGFDQATVTITDSPPEFSVTKTPMPATVLEPGGDVRYTVRVTNAAAEPLEVTQLTDTQDGVVLDLDGQGSCLVTQTIQPGSSYQCSFVRAVSGNVGDVVSDTVSAIGQDNEGTAVTETADARVSITNRQPSLSVSKTANPDSIPEPGGDTVYNVVITNTSTATDPVTVRAWSDSVDAGPPAVPVDLDCTGPGGSVTPEFTLPAGESATCSFAGNLSGDVGTSSSDTFRVSGVDDEGTPVSASGSETVVISDVRPTMLVTKTANPNPIDEPGGPVVFSLAVQNTSPEPITLTSIVDDVSGNLNGKGTCSVPRVIGSGAVWSCAWNGSVSGDVGDVRSNIVVAKANDNEGNVITQTARADVVIADVLPTMVLVKTATPSSRPEPGGNVTFRVSLTNTSPEPITLVSAIDDVYGPLGLLGTCTSLAQQQQTILPGRSYTCTFVAPVVGTAAASPYVDTITFFASDNDGNTTSVQASASVTLTNVPPAITLSKTARPLTRPEPGGTFTYDLRVNNDSQIEPVELTSLIDDIYGDVADGANPELVSTTCALPQTIAVRGSYSCSFQADFTGNARARQTDTVIATAQDDEGTVVTDDDDAVVRLTDVRPAIAATKTPDPATLPEPGGDVTFSVTVSNLSTVEPVQLTRLSDDVYGDITVTTGNIVSTTCTVPQTIAIGGTYACAFTAPVNGTAASSPYTDTITASARDDDGNTVTTNAFANVALTDVLPQLSLVKTASPLTLPEPGGTFTFGLVVTNDSPDEDVTLTDLSDDIYGDVTARPGTCALPQTIAAGDTYSCAFEGDFTGNAFDTQTDTVTATANDDEDNVVTATDDAEVSLTDVLPQLSLVKTASPLTLPEPGGTFTFGLVVTNDSPDEDVTLTDLSDDIYGDVTARPGTCALPQTIAAGDTYSCAFEGDFTGNAFDTQTDTVTATANDDEDNVVTATDDAEVSLTDVLPQLSLVKTASPLTLPEPGGTFTFGLVVTNDSPDEDVTLTDLSDDIYGDVTARPGTCALPQTIAAGDTYSCAFEGDFTGNAFDTQTDTVTATANDDEDNVVTATDDAEVSLTDVLPQLSLVKTASPLTLPEPGGTFTFGLVVTNDSPDEDVTLTDLSDDIYGDVTARPGTCALPQTIAAGDTYSCAFEGDFTGNAFDTQTDTVTATANDDEDNVVTATDDAEVSLTDVLPQLSLVKTASPLTLPEPGGTFTFGLVVTNDSPDEDVTLTDLSDDIYGDVTARPGTCALPQTIAAGDTYSCAFEGDFTGNAFDTQTDTVTATANDDEDNVVTATDDAEVSLTDVPSSIEVTKDATPTEVDEPGAEVVFDVSVENTSFPDVVTIETLSDDIFGDITQVAGDISATDCVVPQVLQPGDVYDCSFTAFVGGNANEIITDTVTADGTDDDRTNVTDDDTADVAILDVLTGISLEKTADPLTLPEPGGTFVFSLTVTNHSVEPVTLTSLSDDIYGDLDGQGTCAIGGTIDVGASYSCSFEGDFSGNSGDSQTDIVSATAQDDEQNEAIAQDDAIVNLTPVPPVISVTKTPSPTQVTAPGGSVTFTVTVTNESTFEPVTLDGLSDSVYGDLNGQGSCLADGSITLQPGQTYSCKFSGDVSGAAGSTHRNTITATASDDDPVPVVVTSGATAEVAIIAADAMPPTDMLPTDSSSGTPMAELLRMFVLFIAASILVGGFGLAVVRRSRV